MGQYYKIVNQVKREFLHPHKFGDGLKLLEFGASGGGTMLGLAILLADGNGRGGGDLSSSNPLIGSWAGDPIVVAGDYADGGRHVPDGETENLYRYAQENYEDISEQVVALLCEDEYLANQFVEQRSQTSLPLRLPEHLEARANELRRNRNCIPNQ